MRPRANHPRDRARWRACLAAGIAAAWGCALAAGAAAQDRAPDSARAESVYAQARPRLLQIRTVLGGTERQTTLGSGFLVSGDGLALTNYHVVSRYAQEPLTYRLEYAAPDRSAGRLALLAIDVVNDLAVVRLDKPGASHFEFDPRALHGTLPKGERLYAMGNPLDLGFTIVEGTYNGVVDKSYHERIHFSGAINAGMSGGPTVTADGRIVGINVAKMLSGELVSFLVPARFASGLLERARQAPLDTGTGITQESVRADIQRQLSAWQTDLYRSFSSSGFRRSTFGSYAAPESAAAWFTCWADTNSARKPEPRALFDTTSCSNKNQLFLSDNFTTGLIELSHTYARTVELNAFQFAAALPRAGGASLARGWGLRHLTPQHCREDFVAPTAAGKPPLRVVWCARAYRDYEGLYDVSLSSVTQDRSREALVSRLSMQGVAYPTALAIGRKFLESLETVR
jgi:serine protease Do